MAFEVCEDNPQLGKLPHEALTSLLFFARFLVEGIKFAQAVDNDTNLKHGTRSKNHTVAIIKLKKYNKNSVVIGLNIRKMILVLKRWQ